MSEESATPEVKEVPAEQPEATPVEEVKNPEAVLNKNRELLADMKKLRDRLASVEQKEQEEREKKMQEEGKLKELLEEKEKKIADLSKLEERLKAQDEYFNKRLEDVTSGLDETQKALIEGYSGDVAQKLELAQKLAGSSTAQPIASGRAGGSAVNEADLDKSKYSIAELTAMRYDNPKQYNQIMRN